MALDYCTSCQSVEQGFRSAPLCELCSLGLGEETLEDLDPEEDDNRVCTQCGEVGTREGIPEHDDYDMER